MLIHSASQLLTLAGGPQRGSALGDLGLIEDGAVLVREEQIVAVGPSAELLARYPGEPKLDVSGRVVLPGFVDPHTHLVWAGDRAGEFEQRLQGQTYLQIQAQGGGILSTVRATRAAAPEDLLAQTLARAQTMFSYGTTTAEAKPATGWIRPASCACSKRCWR
jgi:imidazolonepropionase